MYNEYVSSNGIDMVEGKLLNWCKTPVYYDKKEPFGLTVSLGNMIDMYSILYKPDVNIISFTSMSESSSDVFRFYVENINDAEKIVMAFSKGNNIELPPLHKK